VPDEAVARTVADRLAERGHRLVAIRIVDHFTFDPSSFWYGKPSMRPEYAGWWDVFSAVVDPGEAAGDERLVRWEAAAVASVAREHGGVASGPGGGHPDTVLRVFTRVGLVHELDTAEAEQLRRAVIDTAPPPGALPPPAPGLRYVAKSRGRSEVLAVAEVAQRRGFAELPGPADDGGDVTGLLGELFDGAMHQDTCYPGTASFVPLFAELATDGRLTDYHRAWVMIDLYMIATVGRRHLVFSADSLHARGESAVETPDGSAARAAVAKVLPMIVTQAGESELTWFTCAALSAACPEAATGHPADLEALARQYEGTSRASAIALMHGLVTGDQVAIGAALETLARTAPEALDGLDSPYPRPEHRALAALEHLLIAELGHATS
jgi:hypothetical protein